MYVVEFASQIALRRTSRINPPYENSFLEQQPRSFHPLKDEDNNLLAFFDNTASSIVVFLSYMDASSCESSLLILYFVLQRFLPRSESSI